MHFLEIKKSLIKRELKIQNEYPPFFLLSHTAINSLKGWFCICSPKTSFLSKNLKSEKNTTDHINRNKYF